MVRRHPGCHMPESSPGGEGGLTYRLRWARFPAPALFSATVPRTGHRGANPVGAGSNPAGGTHFVRTTAGPAGRTSLRDVQDSSPFGMRILPVALRDGDPGVIGSTGECGSPGSGSSPEDRPARLRRPTGRSHLPQKQDSVGSNPSEGTLPPSLIPSPSALYRSSRHGTQARLDPARH
jgi:hypothetical protein